MSKYDKPWSCKECGAHHFYDTWIECQYCGAARGEKKEKMGKWKEMEALGRRGCGDIWPKIVQLRAELKTYEDTHGYFEAMIIEAQRHLIELPLDEKKLPEKNRMDKILQAVEKLSDVGKRRLEEILEKTHDIVEGE